jgi:hypothetical protein
MSDNEAVRREEESEVRTALALTDHYHFVEGSRAFDALLQQLAEAEEHERQTHEQLGAILGTGDALHVLAARLKQRAERLETALREAASLIAGELGADWGELHQSSWALIDAALAPVAEGEGRVSKNER